MHAGLDTLCTYVRCTADDLLPERKRNARRRATDAEICTLAVARAILVVTSDRRFLRVTRRQLTHLFPCIPGQAAYHKRRRGVAGCLERLLGIFAQKSPGYRDDLVLMDSTPVECARNRETVPRSVRADAADYGYCASHSRYVRGFSLHTRFAADGTPRGLVLPSAKRDEREVGLELPARCPRRGGETLLCDKGHAGRAVEEGVRGLGLVPARPRRTLADYC